MNKQPEQRSDFLNESDERNHLSDRIRFYTQAGHTPTRELERCVLRLHELLEQVGSDDESIILQDHWAVFYEAEGRFAEAVECRVREIKRIERLFLIGGPVGPINHDFLVQVLQNLQRNYLHINKFDEAAAVHSRVQALIRL